MLHKTSLSLFFFLLFSSATSFAQKELSAAEAQEFYRLIQQSAEYKAMKAIVDSINKVKDEVPQELKIELLKKDGSAPPDEYIFKGTVERKLEIGFTVQTYAYQYDKRKKQIVSIQQLSGPGL